MAQQGGDAGWNRRSATHEQSREVHLLKDQRTCTPQHRASRYRMQGSRAGRETRSQHGCWPWSVASLLPMAWSERHYPFGPRHILGATSMPYILVGARQLRMPRGWPRSEASQRRTMTIYYNIAHDCIGHNYIDYKHIGHSYVTIWLVAYSAHGPLPSVSAAAGLRPNRQGGARADEDGPNWSFKFLLYS